MFAAPSPADLSGCPEPDAERVAARFDACFATQADPWRYRTSWYEARKRALLLAALPKPHFRSAFEPGCANGELSAALAPRCERLLCADFAPHALAAARRRLAPFPHVRVEARTLPRDWPDGRFDLVIVSEIAYYLDAVHCAALARRACAALEADGVLACCHWRHGASDFRLDCAGVHAAFVALARSAALRQVIHAEDADFMLDVWSADPLTVAQRERRA
ncbi:SAM-dependent methyltransferase [Burkholderia sp. WAC0059]|uniref:SAM-dependent methyltransferase n=1 Tax=Burkholderia sp. WAC0059 TaxID=2066022 RepID=UPI000C7EB802|nr:SAM-dependent methyltransferase [Burkholderia sp. WAC0059]PLZ04004.1 SAM-dependent methyltransferase [Burkholderia sp. WAC0059]